MITKVISTYKCDNCGVEAEATDLSEFENLWYSSLLLDFCPKCKDSKKIEADREKPKKAFGEFIAAKFINEVLNDVLLEGNFGKEKEKSMNDEPMNGKKQEEENAFELAEKICKAGHGISHINLNLHSGQIAGCVLKDARNKEVGRGESRFGFIEAVENAISSFRLRQLDINSNAVREYISMAIELAVKIFADKDGRKIFDTHSFGSIINKNTELELVRSDVIAFLSKHPQILRLASGSHWLLLPDGISRYEETAKSRGLETELFIPTSVLGGSIKINKFD